MNTRNFNLVLAFNSILVVGLLCTGCSSSRTDEVQDKTSHAIQRFDNAADKTGNDIKASIDNFGNNVHSAVDGPKGSEIKANASHAMNTVGNDVEAAGHAISSKIEGLGNDLDHHTNGSGKSFEDTVGGFANNANKAMKPMEKSLGNFGHKAGENFKTATHGSGNSVR